MITKIKSIKDYGVYGNHTHNATIDEFKELNIIFGWNYSGKTTLSRIFRSLELRRNHPDYASGKFEVECSQGAFGSANIATSTIKASVFNSDFVGDNLAWNGTEFNPILILGQESIEIKQRISANETSIGRATKLAQSNEKKSASIAADIAVRKRDKAKQIREYIGITEALNATHLDTLINAVKSDITIHVQPDDKVKTLLLSAKADDSDKLPDIQTANPATELTGITTKTRSILLEVPEFSEVIEALKSDPVLSAWIEDGLNIHEGKDTCEFCGSSLDTDRMQKFRGHFSNGLKRFKSKIASLIQEAESARYDFNIPDQSKYYKELWPESDQLSDEFIPAKEAFNMAIESLIAALKGKELSPFDSSAGDFNFTSVQSALNEILRKVDALRTKHNQITIDMNSKKFDAIRILKYHYAAEFYASESIASKEKAIIHYKSRQNTLEQHYLQLQTTNATLEASISSAQKGKEELNLLISQVLGHSNLEIRVTKVGGLDRFKLFRHDIPAKNLSEGEKTAIAFAFFLTRLESFQDLSDYVVYIDDPISSLDSNHIFQINSLIRTRFFWNDPADNNKCKLKCGQLFISTHNFDFFNFTKELPIDNQNRRKFFHTKRIDLISSKFESLPKSYLKYSSEYHYLFSVISAWDESPVKTDLELLMQIPNAFRRFVELYTYSKIPSQQSLTVDRRAERLFGHEKARRIIKVLHFFSHLNNFERIMRQSELLSDIEGATKDLMEILKEDTFHYEALKESLAT